MRITTGILLLGTLLSVDAESCFWLTETCMTYAEAAGTCQQYGGHLAYMKGEQKRAKVKRADIFNMEFVTKYWIGLEATIATSGEWRWADGTPLTWSNWLSSPPSTTSCIQVEATKPGLKWTGEDCSKGEYGLCELPTGTCECPDPDPTGICYRIVLDQLDFYSAVATCQKTRGTLVAFKNQLDVDDFINATQTNTNLGSLGSFWAGINSDCVAGQWRWIDYEEDCYLDYGFSAPNAPFIYWQTGLGESLDKRCAFSDKGSDYRLKNEKCQMNIGVVCRVNISDTVSPKGLYSIFHPDNCPCPPNQAVNGSCYIYWDPDPKMEWRTGKHVCESMRGKLAKVDEQQTSHFIQHEQTMHLPTEYWIGLSRNSTGTFFWNLDTEVTINDWQNWHGGSPDDDLTKQCVKSKDFQWSMDNCGSKRSILCDIEYDDTSMATELSYCNQTTTGEPSTPGETTSNVLTSELTSTKSLTTLDSTTGLTTESSKFSQEISSTELPTELTSAELTSAESPTTFDSTTALTTESSTLSQETSRFELPPELTYEFTASSTSKSTTTAKLSPTTQRTTYASITTVEPMALADSINMTSSAYRSTVLSPTTSGSKTIKYPEDLNVTFVEGFNPINRAADHNNSSSSSKKVVQKLPPDIKLADFLRKSEPAAPPKDETTIGGSYFDTRPSAIVVGTTGVVMFASFWAIILVLDLMTLANHIRFLRTHVWPCCK